VDARETQYTVGGGSHVGYQVWGRSSRGAESVDVLEFGSGLMLSIDDTVDEPSWLGYTERVADFSRLVRFDSSGLGLSDPVPTGMEPTIEGWARDALAVMDAAGCRDAVLLAPNGGAMAAISMAATHPQRVSSLVLVNGTARVSAAADYPPGVPDRLVGDVLSRFSTAPREEDVPPDIATFAPSLAHRVGFREWWERASRRGASPTTALAFNEVMFSADVRSLLPAISCPTLVISRTDGFGNLVDHGRYLAEHISGARFVTVPGRDILPWAGEFDAIVDEIEEFVTGGRGGHAPTRLLATILFTDIVDSTVRAAAMGDRLWRATLDEFDLNVERLLGRHEGLLVKTTGDGTLARFAAPALAMRCAREMVGMAKNQGLELRAGLHAGEVELRGEDIGGLAVHIASRVSAMAGPGEVLVTGTVRDLVVGSGIAFEDRGRHTLKGVPEEWQVLAVARA
jgi:class 3 adenylate cyclase/pimeloyl-ACP methyl ester carboxylesterase